MPSSAMKSRQTFFGGVTSTDSSNPDVLCQLLPQVGTAKHNLFHCGLVCVEHAITDEVNNANFSNTNKDNTAVIVVTVQGRQNSTASWISIGTGTILKAGGSVNIDVKPNANIGDIKFVRVVAYLSTGSKAFVAGQFLMPEYGVQSETSL